LVLLQQHCIRLCGSDGGVRLGERTLLSLTFSFFICFETERRFRSLLSLPHVHLKADAQSTFETS